MNSCHCSVGDKRVALRRADVCAAVCDNVSMLGAEELIVNPNQLGSNRAPAMMTFNKPPASFADVSLLFYAIEQSKDGAGKLGRLAAHQDILARPHRQGRDRLG